MSDPVTIVGRYTITETLTPDILYLAADNETGDTVTVRNVSTETDLPNIDALRQLDHPYIARVHALIQEGDQHYLVTEYVEGGSLRDLLIEQPQMSLKLTVDFGLAVTEALVYAHGLNIAHGNIRPSNVLLKEDGTPRLTGFGGFVLSPYSSPEVWRQHEIDFRSDIWSLGVMLYEMLAGFHPFDAPDPDTVRHKILEEPMPDLLQYRTDTPTALASLVNRMLAKSLDKRIRTMDHLRMELMMIAQMKAVQGDYVKPVDPGEETEVMLRPKEFRPPEDTKGVTTVRPLTPGNEEQYEIIPPPEPTTHLPDPGTVNIRPRPNFEAPPAFKPVAPSPEPESRRRWRLWLILAVLAFIAAVLANALFGGGDDTDDTTPTPESNAALIVEVWSDGVLTIS